MSNTQDELTNLRVTKQLQSYSKKVLNASVLSADMSSIWKTKERSGTVETKTKFNMWQTVFVIQLNETQHKKITIRKTFVEQINVCHEVVGSPADGKSKVATYYKVAMFSSQLLEDGIYATEQEAIEAVINGVWLEEKPLRNDYEYLVARKK